MLQSILGPRQDIVGEVCEKEFEAWLDEQMTREQTHLEPYMDFLGSRNEQDINVNGATLLPDGTRALTEALAVKPGK